MSTIHALVWIVECEACGSRYRVVDGREPRYCAYCGETVQAQALMPGEDG